MSPEGKNIIVFDCEIKEEIDGKIITWNDHDKMGISVACAYDYLDSDYKVYMDDNISDLAQRIQEADMVVAFNSLGFDLPLMAKTKENKFQMDLSKVKSYDMLYHSRRSVGWTDGARFPSGLRLDEHLEATFGASQMKTANGAEAPLMWKRKELGKLISYCLADVKREKMLFEHIWNGGGVTTKTHGTRHLADPKAIYSNQMSEMDPLSL